MFPWLMALFNPRRFVHVFLKTVGYLTLAIVILVGILLQCF